jgi:formate dehydrogenase
MTLVVRLTGEAGRMADRLIENLHLLQDHLGCLPTAHRRALAEWMNLPMAQIEEVATFYAHFDCVERHDERPAPVTIRVCSSLPCQLAGAEALRLALLAKTDPQQVRVIEAPCIGSCNEAPAVLADQRRIGHANAQTVLAHVARQETVPSIPAYADLTAYRARGGYDSLIALREQRCTADEVIAALSQSGLQGLGGAGFPAGRKWSTVRAQPAPRLMTINADEGEPGTFKDRFWLESDPHLMLEGALIAAHCVGVDRIYLYLRDEYPALRQVLTCEIAALEDAGLMPRGFIDMRRGAGAYVCGEESAMIESIEGKRGMPRLRPPYVAQVGLFGYPTLEHNMETLYWVRDILEKGADWFAGHGRNGRKGLRSFSVSGRVKKPGVHLAPAGITVKELIAEYCGGMLPGHQFYGYLPGGASGGILPASMSDIPLDFDTLNPYGCFIGSAAVIIFSDKDKARGAARNVMKFFSEESCGQCTPCRVGTAKALQLMEAPKWNRGLLEELSGAMADASICGLGQAAPNPIRTVMKYFPKEVE